MDLSLTASMIADANSPKLQSPEEETAQTNGFGQNDNRGVDARMSLANTTYTTAYSPNSSGGSEIRATEMSFNTTNGTLDGSALDRFDIP